MNPNASNFDPSAGGYGNTGYYDQGQHAAESYAKGGYFPGAEAYGYIANDPDLATTEPGSYYQVPHLELPITAPVSAVTFDTVYDAIYATTDTVSMSSFKRFNHRASMMFTYTLSDGMLHSSVASHPEAPSKVLSSIYSTIYGAPDSTVSPRRQIPNHAYQPPHGKAIPGLGDLASGLLQTTTQYQLGITKLIPVPGGGVASVSPSAVRVHAVGGLQLADQALEGMLTASPHPQSSETSLTHLAVGGGAAVVSTTDQGGGVHHHLHTLDLWQGLRIVSSRSLADRGTLSSDIAVTALGTSYSRSCVVAGCTDGTIRLVDDRNRHLAQIKCHQGGVVGVAVSSDGTLVATTGYGSSAKKRGIGSVPYAFPDPTVLMNDIRFLGRGGFPHAFAGLRGGPRFVTFLPNTQGQPSNRLFVASGQVGGGCQIVVPFQEADSASFIVPQLGQGEAVHSICALEDKLALGTTRGKVLQYRMAGYEPKAESEMREGSGVFIPSQASTSSAEARRDSQQTSREKQPLAMPPFQPPLPAVSIDASILLDDEPGVRRGSTDKNKSLFGSYVLTAEPTVSAIGDTSDKTTTSFGPLVSTPLVDQSKLRVSASLLSKASSAVDFLQTIPTSQLKIDLLADQKSKNYRGKTSDRSLPNPNKLIYTKALYKIVYEESFNRSKRSGRRSRRVEGDSDDEEDLLAVPARYQVKLRPAQKLAATFSHAEFNHNGIIPGFDYPPTMPNAFVPPVLLLLFFIPELRESVLKSQLARSSEDVVSELGFLFYRVESLARYALLFSVEEGGNAASRLGAWAPSAFISCLASMPEAERLQILDGSPAAVDSPRRAEAFYRFLTYHLNSELESGHPSGLVDSLSGSDFVSINEFISGSGPSSKSTTRQLTIELFYEYFFGPEYKSNGKPSFGEVLQFNLCRATRLRAWSQASKSYETIVQRKIVTSLPVILSLSAACAGRKEQDGLALWRGTPDKKAWLPEVIEVELDEDGLVLVRELTHDEKTGSEVWSECSGTDKLPSSVSEILRDSTKGGIIRRRRYRLDAVLSLVRDDLDRSCPDEVRAIEGSNGHHVLHARVPTALKKRILEQQGIEVKKYLSMKEMKNVTDMTLLGRGDDKDILAKRREEAVALIKSMESSKDVDSGWVLVNGFVVSDTSVEDSRNFHEQFKEPSLVIYRSIEDEAKSQICIKQNVDVKIPPEVVRTTSITDHSKSPYAANQKPPSLPGHGDLVAFDAEFVAVEEEESTLTLTGSRVTTRETRHAIARVSVIDGRPATAGNVIFDDHVQPTEPVTDYLTRFSGILPQDLDPKLSRHHLITARSAYLKLRLLIERGCIFVGHGLQQDFWTANLTVPSYQIIDTLHIYHKPAQRYVSLRFLTNFVLKRDMQQDVHDSVEDALAAFGLYKKAIELKQAGIFEQLLNDLYEYGQKTDWKLGVDD